MGTLTDGLEPLAVQAAKNRDLVRDDHTLAYMSAVISLKRIADDLEQIRAGMKFICERWKS